jgi:hypothetical protein
MNNIKNFDPIIRETSEEEENLNEYKHDINTDLKISYFLREYF